MSFKFLVGQNVEYTPIGDKSPGLYKIIRQMPEEQQAAKSQYLTKSETKSYEHNVPESMLTSDLIVELEHITPKLSLSKDPR